MKVFYERHVCRVVPMPDEVARTFKAIEEDPTVYHTMNGPSEFHVIGTLSNWSIIDRLAAINVPTLLISGRHDEATPATVQPYADEIPGARWHIFEDSSHMPHVEETAACLKVVGDFLEDADERAAGRTGKAAAIMTSQRRCADEEFLGRDRPGNPPYGNRPCARERGGR